MERYKDLKVIVTGGAGFIGSHIVERLLYLGSEVTVIDNFLHGNKVEHLEKHKNLSVCEGDVRDDKVVSRVCKDKDMVFHLAAVVGVEETQMNPLALLDVEIGGTINVLKIAAKNNIKRFVFASSSEVYGDSLNPMKENDPLIPKSTYAVTKIVGEEYCKAIYQEYGMNYTMLRYFNVYGPRQDERFVISRFVNRALSNKPLTVYGDGRQTRDFTYVDDAVELSLLAGIKPEGICQTLNVGTNNMFTINELAALIVKNIDTHNRIEILHADYDNKRPREIEVFTRLADVTRANELLQYQSKVSLESGLRKYINWRMERNIV